MPTEKQAAVVRGNIYSDQGCHLAPSCLNCPFPVCYLDDPKMVLLHMRRLREREQLAAMEFYTSAVAARQLSISERTYLRMRERVKDYFNG